MFDSISIVVGLSFGDEGKGITTDYLCSKARKPIVIRYNGGHQAGHTVNYDSKRHVFQNFGSGTLRGVPTFWSNFCTFNPISFMNEYNRLKQLEVNPVIYVDNLCPVTTPYDIYFNRFIENSRSENKHGSVGVGFGTTVKRHTTPYKLYAQDLRFHEVWKQKLKAIEDYYLLEIIRHPSIDVSNEINIFAMDDFKHTLRSFYESVEDVVSNIDIEFVVEKDFFKREVEKEYTDLIFEGAQGILLDMDFGFFPNVTYSNTTTKNANEIIRRNGFDIPNDLRGARHPEVYYITRAYQTRHGNGFMTNETDDLNISHNFHETNQLNDWQGKFRKGYLDLNLIRYALECDDNFSHQNNANLVFTCLDQIEGESIKATYNNKKVEIKTFHDILKYISSPYIHKIYGSYSDHSRDFKIFIPEGFKKMSLLKDKTNVV